MKTIATILTAAAACFGAVAPAHAAPGDAMPGYKASYDAKRGLYCIRTTALGARTLVPTIVQKSCRTERQWAEVGLTFHHRLAGEQLAQR